MSALANAEHNLCMNTDELVVKEAYANEGPTLKRFRPRAQGRKVRLTNVQPHYNRRVTVKEEAKEA